MSRVVHARLMAQFGDLAPVELARGDFTPSDRFALTQYMDHPAWSVWVERPLSETDTITSRPRVIAFDFANGRRRRCGPKRKRGRLAISPAEAQRLAAEGKVAPTGDFNPTIVHPTKT